MSNKNPQNPRHCALHNPTKWSMRSPQYNFIPSPCVDPLHLRSIRDTSRWSPRILESSSRPSTNPITRRCPALPCPGLPCTRSSLAVRGRPRDIKHSRGRYKSAAQRDRSSLPHRVRRQWTGSRLRPVKRDGAEQGWTGAFCFCPVHQILAPARYQRVVSGPRRGGCK